jgi:pimeloyl-ACP methyl ester carboxylesterase
MTGGAPHARHYHSAAMRRAFFRQRFVHLHGARGLILEGGPARGAPTVVLLASMLVLARSYLWPLCEFTRRFHTIVVQPPGGGRGARLSNPWTMEGYARWTGALLDELDLRDVTLVGHSNSGAVATILAASGAPRVGRIVLADSIGADRAGSLTRIILGRGVDCVHEHELTLAAWNHVVFNAVFHFRNFFEQVRLSARTDLEEPARRVTVPTLIAWGRKDNTMPLRCARLLHSWIPGSRLYVSRHGSHDWINDRPREFAEVLERFIGEAVAAAAPLPVLRERVG